MERLAIISTHPIQYNAPLFKLLANHNKLFIKVFYTLGFNFSGIIDKGFGKTINWDIPLLDGYDFEFVANTSRNPSTSHFKGIINPTLIDKINDFSPNHIMVFGWNFDSHFKVMRYFKNKVPLYFRGDSTLLDEKIGLKVLLRRLALKWVYKHIDIAFYVGTHNKQYYLKHGVTNQNLAFAPHAIDNERFGNDASYIKESKFIKSSLNIPEDNIVFLFSGKFEDKKSPQLLINAFKKIHQKHISLLMVGDGKLENRLKDETENNLNIHFLPFQNQLRMPAVYRVANVLILPSGGPGETWGLSINEAMASGLPVIVSSKVGCAVDLVKSNINGYIFDSGNLDSLIDKLNTCASKSIQELSKMGIASKSIIENWSYKHTIEQFITTMIHPV